MSKIRRISLFAGAVLLLFIPMSEAATRLTYDIGGVPKTIGWERQSFPIQFVIDPQVLGSSRTTILQATEIWSESAEGVLSFTVAEDRGLGVGQDGRNVIVLNDTLLSQNGVLAFTTSWFDDAGRIIESDIQVDRSQVGNLGALLTHELGHSLGFDHSALLSSAMYPYVPERKRLGLDLDDRLALRLAYPERGDGGSISGVVESSTGPIWGAQVVALNSNGQPVASTLSNSAGEYSLDSLPPGDYTVYAEPLDGPVSPRNFSGVWRKIPLEGFPTAFLGLATDRIRIEEADARHGVRVLIQASPASLNARWIGRVDQAAGELSLDSMVVESHPGERFGLAVGGDGFVNGMTEIEVHGEDVKRVSEFHYGANYVWAEFEVSPTASDRSMVVIVNSGNDRATLTGGLRITGNDTGRRKTVGRR